MVTLDQHLSAARREPPTGLAAFVAALRADPALNRAARDRIAQYEAMDRVNRLGSCWISQTKQSTLLAALAAANNPVPDVPAGEKNV
jgi:hypothetical protein